MRISARWITIHSILIIFLVALGWGIVELHNPRLFPVNKIKVVGHFPHVKRSNIERIVRPLVQKSFFDVDLHFIRNQLLALTWIRSVNVARVWPDQLVLSLEEREPVAIWGHHLMTREGVIFADDVSDYRGKLPVFLGSHDKQTLMLEKYALFEAIVSPLGVHITQLQLTSSGVWTLLLSNDVHVMLGSIKLISRLKRFVKVYGKVMLDEKQKKMASVDLRYNDGLAVRWR